MDNKIILFQILVDNCLVFLCFGLEHSVEVLVHVQSLFLISFQIFHVTNEHSINTNSNHVRDDVEDAKGDNDNNTYGNAGDGSFQSMEECNCKDWFKSNKYYS